MGEGGVAGAGYASHARRWVGEMGKGGGGRSWQHLKQLQDSEEGWGEGQGQGLATLRLASPRLAGGGWLPSLLRSTSLHKERKRSLGLWSARRDAAKDSESLPSRSHLWASAFPRAGLSFALGLAFILFPRAAVFPGLRGQLKGRRCRGSEINTLLPCLSVDEYTNLKRTFFSDSNVIVHRKVNCLGAPGTNIYPWKGGSRPSISYIWYTRHAEDCATEYIHMNLRTFKFQFPFQVEPLRATRCVPLRDSLRSDPWSPGIPARERTRHTPLPIFRLFPTASASAARARPACASPRRNLPSAVECASK